MTHNYKIEGMTCSSCKRSVQESLQQLENVEEVEVNLENGEALISMKQHIPIEVLKSALPAKYSLTESKENTHKVPELDQIQEQSKLSQLKPLFLILFYITASSISLHFRNWNTTNVMFDFMGQFYIVFSFFKMLDLKGFQNTFQMYDPLAKRIPFYAKIYPFIETGLGLMFLFRFQIEIALIGTVLILGITTIGVTKTLLDKKSIQCACLGTALNLPMTEATFIENALMLFMALSLLFNL